MDALVPCQTVPYTENVVGMLRSVPYSKIRIHVILRSCDMIPCTSMYIFELLCDV